MPVARWGKAERDGTRFHRLAFHGLDVAAVLAAGLARRPSLLVDVSAAFAVPPERTRSILLLLASLHDLGKVGRAFQALRPDVCQRLGLDLKNAGQYQRQLGHDHLGQAMLQYMLQRGRIRLPAEPPHSKPSEFATLLAAFTGHHGVQPVPDKLPRFWGCNQYVDSDLEAARTLVEAMRALFPWVTGVPAPEGVARVSYLLNGIASIADWLGSHAAFGFHEEPMPLSAYWRQHALPTAERLLDEIRPWPFHPIVPRGCASFEQLFPTLTGAKPTPLQTELDRLFTAEHLPAGPLLVLIEDATGSGKTEAADLACQRLIALDRADGLYVGLPTMATADAAFARRRESGLVDRLYAERADIMLAHSRKNRKLASVETRAELERHEEPACLEWFAGSSKRALLTDVGVGTIDQALLGALRARHAPVRLAGLWRKVLVVDEVHAYDDYMQTILAALLRHQASLGQHVVLMSATLPSRMRDQLVAAFAAGAGWAHHPSLPQDRYPALAVVHARGAEQPDLPVRHGPHVRVQPVHAVSDVEDHLVEWATAGRSAVWFRNTVNDAIIAFDALVERTAASGLQPPLLYHARFLPTHRAAIEEELLRVAGKDADPTARRGRIVVASQAAEQSLDLDFDELATDLAPADALVQRLGRRRRHARDASGVRLADGSDRRPESAALLHLPDSGAVDADWYRGFSPGAAHIYPDHARLWLTQRYLLEPATIPGRSTRGRALDMVRDVKPLIEAVYAEDETVRSSVPAALCSHLDAAAGADCQDRQQARLNRLPFTQGLLRDWHDASAEVLGEELFTPTRLGESFEVLLAVTDEAGPRFLIESDDPLDDSLCRCPRRLTGLAEDDPTRSALATRLSERDRRRLTGHIVVLLADDGAGGWQGTAHAAEPHTSEQGRAVMIRYDAVRGLRVG